ncbi:long-chain fatty acid transport protein [Novosphingobium nitrogenifigens DSM 19370]|uniref:Long-chain fatty acid transport protein n=1 Tax=Novosphingobium nitrogenifigens DSM 19370 TaxID=983920 RepID=F1Z7D6_9SPHN|nr:outer membrane protein transport protein [Novosphingobium nitrogenifigens]EGD59448.1 long-chain fatty acid transport protein [Novosphingobium nitrogenifigens DSM 19370]
MIPCFRLPALPLAHRVGAALMTGAVLMSPMAARATDGYFLDGIGGKAKGAGGVALAQPEDALAIASNPATATEIGHRLDVGVELFIPNRSATITGNAAGLSGTYSGNGANPFVLPDFAYVRPVSDKVSVGIAIYGNGGMNTVYRRNPFSAFGAQGDAGVDLKQIFITPTAAVKVLPGQSLGISPIVVVQAFRAYGIQPFSGYSSDPSHFTNLGTSWSTGAGVRLGYFGHIGRAIRIGGFYETKVKAGHFGKYSGLFSNQGSFDVPAAWGGGIAVTPVRAVTLALDVKRIEYSGVSSVGNPIGLLFTGTPFGATGGPGFGWRDITAIKTGVTWRATPAWTFRAGYSHSGNPVPTNQTLLNILAPGVVAHHITGGATWASRKGVEVTGYVVVAPKNHVYGDGSIPQAFGGGESNIALGETSVGASVGIKF